MNKIRFCPALNRSLVGVIAGLALCQAATAALVVYEDFEYDISGDAGLSGKGSAADGWGGAWNGSGTIVEDNLSYTNGDISINGGGQAVSITEATDPYFSRQFEAVGTSGEDVYFSFLFKEQSGASSDFLNFWLSDNEASGRSNSGGIGVLTTAYKRFGTRMHADGTDAHSTQANGPDYETGVTYLLVGRISTAGTSGESGVYDQVELWVNPDSTTLGAPNQTVDYSSLVDSSVGFSLFGLHSHQVGSGDDYRIDELRIGTSAAGVLSTIPEPSTAALLLGGLTLLAAFGRRARQ